MTAAMPPVTSPRFAGPRWRRSAVEGWGLRWLRLLPAAGVSKATIYNHFGGREGLIDAVIEELVAAELRVAMDAARGVGDPWKRLSDWAWARRDLQYREPAFTDVMLGTPPGSRGLAELASEVTKVTAHAVRSAHDGGVLRADRRAADLFWADVANGLALRELRKRGAAQPQGPGGARAASPARNHNLRGLHDR